MEISIFFENNFKRKLGILNKSVTLTKNIVKEDHF